MTHRAEQIVQAIAAVLDTALTPKGVRVYTHRGDTLDGEQDELPGVSVDYGEFTVTEETEHELYCTLEVPIALVVKLPTEEDVRAARLSLARDIHRAIMASPGVGMPWAVKLGLAFVITVHPAGWAKPPEPETRGEAIVGELTTNWRAEFKTDVDDPGDG